MFTPKEFEFNDKAAIIGFMERYNFGVLISCSDDAPVGTHLPFHVMQRDDKIILTAHMAKANKQWRGIGDKTVMVIFSQPHAYISPMHYEKMQNVPTWNYVAVHAYGKLTIINNTEQGLSILEQMILQSEPGYKQQWDTLSQEYKMNLYRGIVPFEVEITKLETTAKLSQNKTVAERQSIIAGLEKSTESPEREIADMMKKNCPY